MEFSQLVNGIPLAFVVMGLVEWIKALGVSGRLLTILSLVIGLVLGIAYQLSIAMPSDFAGWFGAVVFGLALGLTACKVYDAVRSASKVG
ncbi:MAG: hypothetical protein VB108_01215 [Anaerolineaceae bacterium]|nr:hypothetical protein [Anaerolineaceae bacterium]